MPPDLNETTNADFLKYARIIAPQLLIGKSSGGDFTTAYASVTTITLGTSPYTHTFLAADIIGVQQYNTAGEFVRAFTPIDTLFSITTSILTVTGATFSNTDTFIVYTNLSRTNASGDETSNAIFTQNTNLNPVWAHVLDEKLLNAVTATGRSTFVDVLSYKGLTFCIVASSVTDGATFIFEGSPDADTANVQGLQAKRSNTGAIGNSFNITADGTYYFQIDDAITPKHLDVNLSARTDGTYTVYLAGRAL